MYGVLLCKEGKAGDIITLVLNFEMSMSSEIVTIYFR